jgi:hypothetical protein
MAACMVLGVSADTALFISLVPIASLLFVTIR